ncbi:unnamed protein product [Rotaria magnacalcarata]|uniref:Uncharacterized protein n=3 Tax=Rotaria magnacalcarata TaxID=392030 RepID=A0A815UQ86_9BILA|nr:unnamed protein product [Rotaria magnacalcarata]CAF1520284.1 unnamed protein product [Rotaria magnacalcarata]CAF2056312.1 unnamed protein product [Rotaria magnacalcarata]CAF2091544.1 unnamed protein product [Rotaria magnacalcarata]CAF2201108.1 unnamed protein product [Rotaria magnacalcarata]
MVLLHGKLVIAGDMTVGKTAICHVAANDANAFPKSYNCTNMADLVPKQIRVPDSDDTVEFFLIDSAGNSIYLDSLRDIWVTMDMYCIVYDITNRNSFKNCGMWLEQLSQSRGDHNVFGVLIGNKKDKESYRVVSTQEGKQLATSRKLEFFECSAKDNKGIAEIFKYLASEFVGRYRKRIKTLEKMGRDNY